MCFFVLFCFFFFFSSFLFFFFFSSVCVSSSLSLSLALHTTHPHTLTHTPPPPTHTHTHTEIIMTICAVCSLAVSNRRGFPLHPQLASSSIMAQCKMSQLSVALRALLRGEPSTVLLPLCLSRAFVVKAVGMRQSPGEGSGAGGWRDVEVAEVSGPQRHAQPVDEAWLRRPRLPAGPRALQGMHRNWSCPISGIRTHDMPTSIPMGQPAAVALRQLASFRDFRNNVLLFLPSIPSHPRCFSFSSLSPSSVCVCVWGGGGGRRASEGQESRGRGGGGAGGIHFQAHKKVFSKQT